VNGKQQPMSSTSSNDHTLQNLGFILWVVENSLEGFMWHLRRQNNGRMEKMHMNSVALLWADSVACSLISGFSSKKII